MGQFQSTTCVQIGGPVPVSVAFNCLPPGINDRFKALSKELINDNVTEIIVKVAERGQPNGNVFPHDTTKDTFAYKYQTPGWWTSGFFPGSLWLLYERSLKVPVSVPSDDILDLALQWQKGMEDQQYNNGTHDLGFMIMPSFFWDWRLRGSQDSRAVVVQTAYSLSSRYSDTVKAIRSWDSMTSPVLNFTDKNKDFLVIIDNMMNLDLLYHAANLTGDSELTRRANNHAKTTIKHHIRPNDGTYHLVDYDPATGGVKGRYTVQGYADESTWSRGQAWGLYGYTRAYALNRDREFRDTAIRLAKYFVKRVEETSKGTGVVYWDFDAPRPPIIRDMSAAMITCSGLLELYSLTKDTQFLPAVATILEYAVRNARAPQGADTILRGATVHNNPNNPNPNFETGVVYADYYFLEIGNKLIELGLTK